MPPIRRKTKSRRPARRDSDAAPSTPRPDEMDPELIEFIQAMDHYKRVHQRPFPNWSEVLEVLKGLGYER